MGGKRRQDRRRRRHPGPRRPLLPVLTLVWAVASCTPSGDDRQQIAATTLEGTTVDLLAGGPSAVVLLFITPDCPISNRYVPEINRIAEDYRGRRVDFYLVYTDPAFSDTEIRSHLASYDLAPPALLDFGQALRARTGVEVTPEAALLDSRGEVVYLGRIDNRFVDFGKTRPKASRRDLRLALDSVLAGRPVELQRTEAIGCFVVPLAAGSAAESRAPKKVHPIQKTG